MAPLILARPRAGLSWCMSRRVSWGRSGHQRRRRTFRPAQGSAVGQALRAHAGGSSRACRRSAGHAPRSPWLRPGCSRRPVRRSCPAPAGALGVQARHNARTPVRFSRISNARCTGLARSSASPGVFCRSQSIPARAARAMDQGPCGTGRSAGWLRHRRGGSGSTRRFIVAAALPSWALPVAARQVRMPLGRIKSPAVTRHG
jgi:hypothetical protein